MSRYPKPVRKALQLVPLVVLFSLSLLMMYGAVRDYDRSILFPETTTGTIAEISLVESGFNKHYVAHDLVLILHSNDRRFTFNTSLESCRWVMQKAPVGTSVSITHRPAREAVSNRIIELITEDETIISNRDLKTGDILVGTGGVLFMIMSLYIGFRTFRKPRRSKSRSRRQTL